MSKQALYFYAENLHLVQKATFTTPAGKEYGLGENGRDLLIFLCNAANEKRDYRFHMGYSYIAEETDIHISTVKRLMAGLEQLGWITRTGEVVRHMGRGAPTVEYELTFYSSSLAQNMRTGRPTSRPGATDNLGKANTAKDAPQYFDTETEPKPETEPQPEPGSPKSDDLQAGRQRKEEEVLRLCIGLEIESMSKRNRVVKPGLRKIWEREYPLLIAKAIEQGQGTTHEAMAQYCYDIRSVERTGYTSADTPAQVPTTKRPKEVCGRCENKNTDIEGHEGLTTQYNLIDNSFTPCELCNGTGYHDREPLTEYDYFPADEEPTPIEPPTKRVSAGLVSNTHIPMPPGSADPQSFNQFVKDMSQNFTHK